MLGKVFKSAAASLLIVVIALVAFWMAGPIASIEPYMNYLLGGRMVAAGLVLFIAILGVWLYKDHVQPAH